MQINLAWLRLINAEHHHTQFNSVYLIPFKQLYE